jgi:hypothetical protein
MAFRRQLLSRGDDLRPEVDASPRRGSGREWSGLRVGLWILRVAQHVDA